MGWIKKQKTDIVFYEVLSLSSKCRVTQCICYQRLSCKKTKVGFESMAVWIQSFGVGHFDLTPKCQFFACPQVFSLCEGLDFKDSSQV